MSALVCEPSIVDFGSVYYEDSLRTQAEVRVSNSSDFSVEIICNVSFINKLEEFPVVIRLVPSSNDANTVHDSSVVTILPHESLYLQFELNADIQYISRINVGTSYFKVARNFMLQYRTMDLSCDSATEAFLSLSYVANLCSSVMFIDKSNILFENSTVGETLSQEFMLWNRSECPLEFTYSPHSLLISGGAASDSFVKLVTGDADEEMDATVTYSVPSFAPKLIKIKARYNMPGKITSLIEFANKNNPSNSFSLSVVGIAVNPKEKRPWFFIDEDFAALSRETLHKRIKRINLGDLFCGQRVTRRFTFVNTNSKDLKLKLHLNQDDQEVRVSYADQHGAQRTIDNSDTFMNQSNANDVKGQKPAVVEERREVVNPFAHLLHEASRTEATRTWDFDTANKAQSTTQGQESIAFLCGKMFSVEAFEFDYGEQEYLDITYRRPFQVITTNTSKMAKAALITANNPPDTADCLDVAAQSRLELTAEVIPLLQSQLKQSEDVLKLHKRSVLMEIEPLVAAGEAAIVIDPFIIEFRACQTRISAYPTLIDLGLSHVGESYTVEVFLTNLSELPFTVKATIQCSGCSCVCPDTKLSAFERAKVKVKIIPAMETERYVATLRFRTPSAESEETVVNVVGKAASALSLKFHKHFYKVIGDNVRHMHQISAGCFLSGQKNYSLIELQGVSRAAVTIHILTRAGGNCKAISVDALSAQLALNELKSNIQTESRTGHMSSALDSLKWGVKFEDQDITPGTAQQRLLDRSQVSVNLEALDVTPFTGRRSTGEQLTRKYGSLGQDPVAWNNRHGETIEATKAAPPVAVLPEALTKVEKKGELTIIELIKLVNDYIHPLVCKDVEDESLKLAYLNASTVPTDLREETKAMIAPLLGLSSEEDWNTGEISKAIEATLQSLTKLFEQKYASHTESFSAVIDQDEFVSVGSFTLQAGERKMIVLEINPLSREEAIDGSRGMETIALKMETIDREDLLQSVSDLSTADKDLENALIEKPEILSNLLTLSFQVSYQLYRSELALFPQSLNFGSMLVNEIATRTVRLVNKSALFCLYLIEKSGSIASGYLSIPGGRRGMIPPFSTISLEVRFKPTMAVLLNEEVYVKNLLNQSNTRLLTVKGDVSRTETFGIIFDELPKRKISDLNHQALVDAKKGTLFEKMLSRLSLDKNSSRSLLHVYMGTSAVGKSPTIEISFRIKNLSNKTRQFIIDGASNDAVELLDLTQFLFKDADNQEEHHHEVMSAISVLSEYGHGFPPIPEVLQNILCMRCHFSSKTVVGGEEKGDAGKKEEDDALQQLLDSLEKAQQKLKIAIRKGKVDKINKNRKKIDELISQLSSKAATKAAPQRASKVTAVGAASSSTVAKAGSQPHPAESVDTELAHVIEVAAGEEVHIHMRVSYLPAFHYRPWKGLLPFVGRVRVFELRNEDFQQTIHFGTLLYSSTFEMTAPFEMTRSRFNSFDSEVVSDTSSVVAVDRKIANTAKEAEPANAPFLITIPLWCSVMTKQVFPKYKKQTLTVLGGCVKLARSRKDLSLSGTFSITSLHSRQGQLEFSVDEKYFPLQALGENKAVQMRSYGVVLLKHNEDYMYSGGGGTQEYHDLSAQRFTIPLQQRARKVFSLRWNPPQFLEPPSEEFKLTGSLKVTFGSSDNTYHSMLLPFVCVVQHKSVIDVDKYCSFADINVGSYATSQFIIRNTSETDELSYIVTEEQQGDVELVKGFIEIIGGKSNIIPPSSSKLVTVMFNATSLGRFEHKLWIQNLKDTFDQKRVVVQATITVSPSRFVLFPDLEPEETLGKRKEIDFGLVEIQDDENQFCNCEYDFSNKRSGVYVLRLKNVHSKTLAVTAISNLRKQCFIYADEDLTIPLANTLLPKDELTLVYIVLKPTRLSDNKAAPAADQSRELQGGIRFIFYTFDDEDEISSSLSSAATQFRKLFESALQFKAIVGKSAIAARLLCDDIQVVDIENPPSINLHLRNTSNSFVAKYCLCLCVRSSFCGINMFSIDDSHKIGSLRAQEEITIPVVIAPEISASSLTYSSMSVINMGSNSVITVAKMFQLIRRNSNDRLRSALLSSDATDPSSPLLIRTKGQIGTNEQDCDLTCTVVASSANSWILIVDNISEQPMNLRMIANFNLDVELIAGESSNSKETEGIDTNLESKLQLFNRHLQLQAQSVPPFRLATFHSFGKLLFLQSRAHAVFRVAVTSSFTKGGLAHSDLKKLTSGEEAVHFPLWIGFVENINKLQALFIDDDAPMPLKRDASASAELSDSSFLRVASGQFLRLNAISPKLQIKPKQVTLLPFAADGLNQDQDQAANGQQFAVELTNRGSMDVVVLFEFSVPWKYDFTIKDSSASSSESSEYTRPKFPDWFRLCAHSGVKVKFQGEIVHNAAEFTLAVHTLDPKYEQTYLVESVSSSSPLLPIDFYRIALQKIKIIVELPPSSTDHLLRRSFELSLADAKAALWVISDDLTTSFAQPVAATATAIAAIIHGAILLNDPILVPNKPLTRKNIKMQLSNKSIIPTIWRSQATIHPIFADAFDLTTLFSNSNDDMAQKVLPPLGSEVIKLRLTIKKNQKFTTDMLTSFRQIKVAQFEDVNAERMVEAFTSSEYFVSESSGNEVMITIGTLQLIETSDVTERVYSYAIGARFKLGEVLIVSQGERAMSNLLDSSSHNLGGNAMTLLFSASAEDSQSSMPAMMFPHWRCIFLEQQLDLSIHNVFSSSALFKITSHAIRAPGVHFQFVQTLPDKSNTKVEFWTDTIKVAFLPNEGSIVATSLENITAVIIPASASEAVNVALTIAKSAEDGGIMMEGFSRFCIDCTVMDDSNSFHPQTQLHAEIVIDQPVQLLRSQPISVTNRKKQHLDLVMTDASTSKLNSPIDNSTVKELGSVSSVVVPSKSVDPFQKATTAAAASVRKRGITPHPLTEYHGYIDLGKQQRRSDALEWMITLENRSKDVVHYFAVSCIAQPATESWMLFGQNGGVIPANDSNAFMVYFHRSHAGKFVGYIFIRDLLYPSAEPHIICVTMEVVVEELRMAANAPSSANLASLDIESTTISTKTPSVVHAVKSSNIWIDSFVDLQVLASSDEEEESTNTTFGQVLTFSVASHHRFLRLCNKSSMILEFTFTSSVDGVAVLPTDSFSVIGRNKSNQDIFCVGCGEEIVLKVSFKAAFCGSTGVSAAEKSTTPSLLDSADEQQQLCIKSPQSPVLTCFFTLFDNLFIQIPVVIVEE